MANPQLENGYTRISNEIIQAVVRSSMSGTQIRFILWLIRLTYGFHRKEIATNVNAFATKLRSNESYVYDVIVNLEQKKVITVEWATKKICNISINKDFDQWRVFA